MKRDHLRIGFLRRKRDTVATEHNYLLEVEHEWAMPLLASALRALQESVAEEKEREELRAKQRLDEYEAAYAMDERAEWGES